MSTTIFIGQLIANKLHLVKINSYNKGFYRFLLCIYYQEFYKSWIQ